MRRTAQAFLGSLMEDAIDAAAAAAFLGIDARQVSQLHRAKAIPTLMEGAGAKVHALVSKADLKEARDAVGDQMSLASVAQALGISRHGVEQLLCVDLLSRSAHKAVAALYAGVRVSRRSMTALIAGLEEKQRPSVRSFAPVISLRKAAHVVGGREKPWAHVFAALIDGKVGFTMCSSTTARILDRIMIDPADAARLFVGQFDRNDHHGFPFVADMARREASELLNLGHKTAVCFAALPADCHARGRRLAIAAMLRIAAARISPQEIRARWGVEQPFGLGKKTELGWPRSNAEGAYGTSRPQSVHWAFDFDYEQGATSGWRSVRSRKSSIAPRRTSSEPTGSVNVRRSKSGCR